MDVGLAGAPMGDAYPVAVQLDAPVAGGPGGAYGACGDEAARHLDPRGRAGSEPWVAILLEKSVRFVIAREEQEGQGDGSSGEPAFRPVS